MSRPKTPAHDPDDREVEDLVWAASIRDTHEGEIFVAVIDRIEARDRRPWVRLPQISSGLVATGFAAMMLASGIAGYGLAGPSVLDGDILTLAFGEPSVLGGSLVEGESAFRRGQK